MEHTRTDTVTIFDSQSGNLLTGYPTDITDYSFTLRDENGDKLGVFSRDNLKEEKPKKN